PVAELTDPAGRDREAAAELAELLHRAIVALRGEDRVTELLQAVHPFRRAARPDHRLNPGYLRQLLLEAVDRGEVLGAGDRAFLGDGDYLEGRVPAGADHAVDEFDVLAGRRVLRELFRARR